MTIQNIFLISCFILIAASCSSTAKKDHVKYIEHKQPISSPKLSAEQIEKNNELQLKITETQIQELIVTAKENGPEAIQFLSRDLFLKASYASMHGDHLTASFLLKQIHKIHNNDTFIEKRYALELIRAGKLSESKPLLEKIYASTKDKKEKEQYGLILSGIYTSVGKKNKARKLYHALLKINPSNQEACVFLAKSYALEKKFTRSTKVLNKCEKSSKKKGIFSYYKGKIKLSQDKINEALKSFKRASKIQPDYFQAVLAEGIIYEEKGQWKKAIKTYKKFLKKNPHTVSILERLVQAYFSINNYKKVVPYAQKLADLDPGNLNVKVKLGILYTDSREYQKALKIFKDILRHSPDSDKIIYYIAAIYQETKKFEQAIEYYQQIPNDSVLYSDSLIQSAQILSNWALEEHHNNSVSEKIKTREFLNFIQEKLSKAETPKIQLAMIKASYFEAIDNIDEAINSLSSYKDKPSFNESNLYYLAALYDKNEKYQEAHQILWRIIKNNPKNAHAWNFLGYSLIEREVDLDKAYEYIKKAVALAPDDGYIRDSLGWYYYKRGNMEQALKELEIARKFVDNDMTISKHLGIVYQNLNKYQKAKKFFVEALHNSKLEEERNVIYHHLKDLDRKRLPASR